MKLTLDEYAHLQSPIHRWEQSSKLVALLTLIFAFAFVQKVNLLPIMILVTLILFFLSRLPWSFLLKRLRYPGVFLASMVLLLPFVAGKTVLFSFGFLSVKQEGCIAVMLIAARFLCILTVSIVLFGTAPFLTSMKALRSLGLPHIIVDMMLLSYRYLEQLAESRHRMQQAMRLRGFQAKALNRRTLKMLANVAGSLLVRSYEQSQRVYQAMKLRGYGYQTIQKQTYDWHWLWKLELQSLVAFYLTLLIAIAFFIANIFS